MKQPLMLIPPAQAEVLSDYQWTDAPGETRFAPLLWRDDDLPEEAIFPSLAPPGESAPRRSQRMRAA